MQKPRNRYSFPQKALIAAAFASAAAAVLGLVWMTANVLVVIFGGILLAIFLRGTARWISRFAPIPLWGSLILVVLVMAGLIAGGGALLAGSVAKQVNDLVERIPASEEAAKKQLSQHPLGKRILENAPTAEKALSTVTSGKSLGGISTIFSGTLGVLANVFIILFLGLYMAATPEQYREIFIRLFPSSKRDRCEEVMDDMCEKLWYWLLGRMMAMVIIFVATSVGLGIIGVPAALALGLLAGLLNFIPNIGPLLSAIPAVLMALTLGTTEVLYVGLLYLAIQIIESYVLTPLVEKRSVKLSPAFTIAMQLIFGVLLGAAGLTIATPLTAAGVVLVDELYMKRMDEK